MRIQLFFLLPSLLFVMGVYWYQSTALVCPVPLQYRIGEIDSGFALNESEARAHVAEAEAVWEKAAGRDLFVYEPTAHFPINFIFDDRQATADAEVSKRMELDAKKADNQALLEQIAALQKEYEALEVRYKERMGRYESQLTAYNKRVGRYNDEGGAPPDVYEEFGVERQVLEQESAALKELAVNLNTLAAEINTLSERGNKEIDAYNTAVNEYNRKFGYSREFTQGDYQGEEINIYKFSNEAELVAVLVHEFGHALGIGHVEDEGSVMYYLLEEPAQTPVLSEADVAALVEVCGEEETWQQRLRHTISTLLR